MTAQALSQAIAGAVFRTVEHDRCLNRETITAAVFEKLAAAELMAVAGKLIAVDSTVLTSARRLLIALCMDPRAPSADVQEAIVHLDKRLREYGA